jgi:hypothetical protein
VAPKPLVEVTDETDFGTGQNVAMGSPTTSIPHDVEPPFEVQLEAVESIALAGVAGAPD